MGFSENSAKRKVHSNTSLPQEIKEPSHTLNLHLKQLEKRRKELQNHQKEKIIKIRAEINEKETKETSNNQENLKASSLKRR